MVERTADRRPFGGLLRPLLGILSAAALAGLTFGWVVQWRTVATDVLSTREPPGRLVEVEGAAMHIDCRGDGAPTVVLEAGIVSSSRIWESVQAAVAPRTRVCLYDRRGYGWSEPAGDVRSGERIATELWQLLDAADEAGLSRIYGGIHVEADDFAGRLIGAEVGVDAWNYAATYLGL